MIFGLFGITMPAFRVTGGALVALVGFHMLQGGQHSTVHHPNAADLQKCLEAELEIALTPLAMPILAGPGTIATAMNYASAGTVADFALTVSAFGVLCAITYTFFLFGEQIVRFLGENGVKGDHPLHGLDSCRDRRADAHQWCRRSRGGLRCRRRLSEPLSAGLVASGWDTAGDERVPIARGLGLGRRGRPPSPTDPAGPRAAC
jgi:hypothetical protein